MMTLLVILLLLVLAVRLGGERAWAAATHGGHGKRREKQLHLAVDRAGLIVGHARTEAIVDDVATGLDLVRAVDGALTIVTADAAYDTVGEEENRDRSLQLRCGLRSRG